MPSTPPLPTAAAPRPSPGRTRERLIAAMADALQQRGLHGMGLNELIAQAGAPKGVLYHHFPGGKTELAVAAVHATVQALLGALEELLRAHRHPADALEAWMARVRQQLHGSGYARGCPLATVALETVPGDTALRQALAEGFAVLRERLARAFGAAGLGATEARRLSTLVVSAYEGALVQARVAGDPQALDDTTQALAQLLRRELPTERAR